MFEMIAEHIEGAVAIVALAFAGFAQYRGIKRGDHVALDQAKDEQIRLLKDDKEIYREGKERIAEEYKQYREKAHAQVQDVNARMIALTAENAELRVKTDVTPFISYAKQQDDINEKVVIGLNQMTAMMVELVKLVKEMKHES